MIRYRRRSLNTVLGVTKAKRQVKKELGVYEVTQITNAPRNAKRRARRKVGLETELVRFLRFLGRKA